MRIPGYLMKHNSRNKPFITMPRKFMYYWGFTRVRCAQRFFTCDGFQRYAKNAAPIESDLSCVITYRLKTSQLTIAVHIALV